MSDIIKIEFKNIFRVNFLLIFLAVLISTMIDQSLNKQIENVIKSPLGLSNIIWLWGALSLVSSLLFPLLISLLCSQALTNISTSNKALFKQKFELSLVETLRAWGKTFLWCFLFIIPGLIKYSYYLVSPFVVLFSKKYAAGEVDALDYSEYLSKKFWWKLNFWLTVFYLIIPIILSSMLDEHRLFSTHPIPALLCTLLDTILILLFHYLILKSFIQKLNEVENVIDV